MKQFTTDEQVTFWNGNEEPFKGDSVSKIILMLAKKYIGKNAIDVGGGSGALLENFHQMFKGKKIIAIDLAPKHPKVLEMDCTKIKYPDSSFDTIFCTDVIEHLSDEDLDKCLAELNRVLKEGKYGIFSTINDENLMTNQVTCPDCGIKFHKWGHCQIFTESRIKKLFKKNGFEIIKIKKLNLGFLAKAHFLARTFYFFKLERIFKIKLFVNDLFFIVKKIKNKNSSGH